MKILDRYIGGLYASAFGIFILSFLLLVILFDFVLHANDFLTLREGHSLLLFCLEYYAVRVPFFLLYLLPVVTLFAAMFTCHRLAKNNEFLPAVTAGVSIRRATVPFFVAGAVVAAAVAAMEEWVLPQLGPLIVQSENVLRRGDIEYNAFVRDREGDTFYFAAYRYSNFEAERVVIAVFGPERERRIERLIKADRGVCVTPPAGERPGVWRFYDGVVTQLKPTLERGEDLTIPPEGYALETDLDPVHLTHEEKVGMTFHSFAKLQDLIRDNPLNPLFSVRLNLQLAEPLGSLLLLLLGIPFIAVTQRQNVFLGVGICMVICAGYYVTQFICVDGGMKRWLSPEMAGWTPPLLFGMLGSGLFYGKLKT